jgi:[ribosomal protein S5]-alanine N-acetyltransferase
VLPHLQTPRLTLVPWSEDDIDTLHAIWTDPDVRRYLWDDLVISRETAAAVILRIIDSAQSEGVGCWTIRAARQAAGFCGFRFIEDSREVELLYGLLPAYQGRGIATEAARAALDYFWNHTPFTRVFARTDPPNTASVEVMRRLGMRHESRTVTMITYILDRPPQ